MCDAVRETFTCLPCATQQGRQIGISGSSFLSLTSVLVARPIGSPRWPGQVDPVGYSVHCAEQRCADCWKKARPDLAVRRPRWLPSALPGENDLANNPGSARSAGDAHRKE